jgi:hypothetical protein
VRVQRYLWLVGLVLCATIGFTATVDAASPSGVSATVAASASDDGIATSYFEYDQSRGVCNYRYRYQRSRSYLNLYYNDGDVYALRIIQYLQYKNSRGRWVTARSASKTGYVYGNTGSMSLSKTFRWTNRILRTRDTRVRTQFRLYRYSGGYDYVNTANNYCG